MKKIFTIFICFLVYTSFVAAQNFAGSDACKGCHSSKHADWVLSGHPYKIQKLEPGQGPQYPTLEAQKNPGKDVDYLLITGVPKPPENMPDWSGVGFVLGGFHSNARFLDTEGYFIYGDSAQYNLITDKWVGYNSGHEKSQYKYACYKCHTTGPSAEKTTEFEAYPGIEGSWAETGVGCEGCHGPSDDHAASPSSRKPPKEGYATCNNCHARDRGESYAWNKRVQWRTQTVNDVATGFIRHREQGDMMLNSRHEQMGMTCANCHEPHKSVYFNNGGVKERANEQLCKNCHTDHIIQGHGDDKATCLDCHMPFAAKNGDVKTPWISEQSTHYWRILTNPITMFENVDTIDGKFFIKQDANGGGITLDYTCIQCHTDKDIVWASENAKDMHNTVVAVNGENTTPTAYTLTQNYPNPFNPTTKIDFTLAKSGSVSLRVYSISGELIQTVVNGEMAAGRHTVNFDGSHLSSGVYIYAISSNEFSFSRKMILMK